MTMITRDNHRRLLNAHNQLTLAVEHANELIREAIGNDDDNCPPDIEVAVQGITPWVQTLGELLKSKRVFLSPE